MPTKADDLLLLLDITSFDSEGSNEALFQQVIEKASRLLSVRKVLLSISDPVIAKCSGLWGFTEDELELYKLEPIPLNGYLHQFSNNKGHIYLEQSSPLSTNDQRIYALFTRSLEDALSRKLIRESLRYSEKKYRDILAHMQEGYYEIDLRGRIEFCNTALYDFLGYKFGELAGINMLTLCEDRRQVLETFIQVWNNKQPKRLNVIKMKRKDGSTCYGEISIGLTKDKANKIVGFNGLVRDITERVQYQHKLEFLSWHDVLTELYNRTYFEQQLARKMDRASYPVSLLIADLDGLKIINDSMGHPTGDRLLRVFADIFKTSVGDAGVAARLGGDEFGAILPNCDEQQATKLINEMRQLIAEYNLENKALPLSISLGVATAETQAISLNDIYIRADDQMLHDKLFRSDTVKTEIVKTLMAALAERDYITHGHDDRLEKICLLIAKRLNLSDQHLKNLSLLAKVHDLGKVGIPDSILSKPSSLTEYEWGIMKQHPEKGYRIATSSPHLAGISRLILCHHERWDGLGYPLGLGQKEIPIECRIFAIADTFDSMISDRPYRTPASYQGAIDEIKSNAGTQFDPELVKVALPVLKEIVFNKTFTLT